MNVLKNSTKTNPAGSQTQAQTRLGRIRFSIKGILIATLAIALWLALYRELPSAACIIAGPTLLAALAFTLRRTLILLWLPMALSVGILLDTWRNPGSIGPNDLLTFILIAAVALASILSYSLIICKAAFHNKTTHDEAFTAGFFNCIVGGFFSGAMFGIPIVAVVPFGRLLKYQVSLSAFEILIVTTLSGILLGITVALFGGLIWSLIVEIEIHKCDTN